MSSLIQVFQTGCIAENEKKERESKKSAASVLSDELSEVTPPADVAEIQVTADIGICLV